MLAYVKVTVGCNDESVVASLDKVFLCNFVSELDTAFTVGGAACFKVVKGLVNLFCLVAGNAVKNNTCSAGLSYDGNTIVGSKVFNQKLHGIL